MKILIIGNIGSGKTTLGRKIQELTGFKFIQIDELRERFFEKKVSEEYYCLYEFLKAIEDIDSVILEFTGAGCHKYAIKRALELTNDTVLIILCKTKLISTLRERIKEKEFNYVNPFNIDINEHIQFVENELNQDICNKFWSSNNFKFFELFAEDLNDIKEIEKILNKKLLN